jgi:hypothetical protein
VNSFLILRKTFNDPDGENLHRRKIGGVSGERATMAAQH